MDPLTPEQQVQKLQKELQAVAQAAEAWARKAAYYEAEANQLKSDQENTEARRLQMSRSWAAAERTATFALDALREVEEEVGRVKDSAQRTLAKALALERDFRRTRAGILTLRDLPRADEAEPTHSSSHSP